MAASKHFCLKWNNFQANILESFESLHSNEELTDVTLTCDGINLKAHRFVLSACSPYFRTVFKENPCSHPIVILKDVQYLDLVAIINFMYHGEVLVAEDRLTSFLETAKLLQVSGLKGGDSKSESASTPSAPPPLKKPRKQHDRATHIPSTASTLSVPGIPPSSGSVAASSSSILERSLIGAHTSPPTIISHTPSTSAVPIIKSAPPPPPPATPAVIKIEDEPDVIDDDSKMYNLADPEDNEFGDDDADEEPDHQYDESSNSGCGLNVGAVISQVHRQQTTVSGPPSSLAVHAGNIANLSTSSQHHNSQEGRCPHCAKSYSNQSALKYHVRLVHSDMSNMYCCHLCPESFDYREGYKKHMNEAHASKS